MDTTGLPLEAKDLDLVLSNLCKANARLKVVELEVEALKLSLSCLYALGIAKEKMQLNGFNIIRSEGKKTYTYSPAIKAEESALKEHKEVEVALGVAKCRQGSAFWSVKPPKEET